MKIYLNLNILFKKLKHGAQPKKPVMGCSVKYVFDVRVIVWKLSRKKLSHVKG